MYKVKVACKKCGRTSVFPNTDKVRACPLCRDEKLDNLLEEGRTKLRPVLDALRTNELPQVKQ